MEGRLEVLTVVRREARSVDQMVDRSVDQMVDRSVDQMVDRSAGPKEGHSVDQTEVLTVDHLVDLKVAPKEDLMEAHLGGLQDLSEVRVALHRFAQLVLVQAQLQALRALVALGLEVVFA